MLVIADRIYRDVIVARVRQVFGIFHRANDVNVMDIVIYVNQTPVFASIVEIRPVAIIAKNVRMDTMVILD